MNRGTLHGPLLFQDMEYGLFKNVNASMGYFSLSYCQGGSKDSKNNIGYCHPFWLTTITWW